MSESIRRAREREMKLVPVHILISSKLKVFNKTKKLSSGQKLFLGGHLDQWAATRTV